jgi:hypothetical protein
MPMNKFTRPLVTALLLSTVVLCLQSCNDGSVQLERQKIQFTFSTGSTPAGRAKDVKLPENTRLRISIETSAGASVFSNHEVEILKAGDGYIAAPVELLPGSYVVTDFMLVHESEVLYATPKSGTPLSQYVTHPLPFSFSVAENSVANVAMQVMDVRDEEPEAYGYASFKINIVNTLSITVFSTEGGQTSLTGATAELRKGKKLIKNFSLNAGVNTISFEGEPDTVYTLIAYTDKEAGTKTFNFKALKQALGANPLKLTLESALILSLESYVDEGNEYEEYFDLALDGTGAVNINWGDGHQESGSLPYQGSHEYTNGTYTAIVTGDVHQLTNFSGFSYGTIIFAIKGLTNLTALKTYDPSWGAVPIKVDLSNCKKLETVYVAKYGAPYETIDLRTDFKLPEEHFITKFVFDAPSFDMNREYISAEELEVMVDNIYDNVMNRYIYGGIFAVNPVEAPSPETQRKLDFLQNSYDWDIRFNDAIYEEDAEAGRIKRDSETRRENWVRNKFPNKRNNKMVFTR